MVLANNLQYLLQTVHFSHNMLFTDSIVCRKYLGGHTCVPVFKEKVWDIEHQEWKYSFRQTVLARGIVWTDFYRRYRQMAQHKKQTKYNIFHQHISISSHYPCLWIVILWFEVWKKIWDHAYYYLSYFCFFFNFYHSIPYYGVLFQNPKLIESNLKSVVPAARRNGW